MEFRTVIKELRSKLDDRGCAKIWKEVEKETHRYYLPIQLPPIGEEGKWIPKRNKVDMRRFRVGVDLGHVDLEGDSETNHGNIILGMNTNYMEIERPRWNWMTQW